MPFAVDAELIQNLADAIYTLQQALDAAHRTVEVELDFTKHRFDRLHSQLYLLSRLLPRPRV